MDARTDLLGIVAPVVCEHGCWLAAATTTTTITTTKTNWPMVLIVEEYATLKAGIWQFSINLYFGGVLPYFFATFLLFQ